MERDFYLKTWPKIRSGTLEIVDTFEDADLTFVPVSGGWTLGQIILHISDAVDYWLHSGILSPLNVFKDGFRTLEHYPNLAAIKAYLVEEHARTQVLLEGFDPADWYRAYAYPDGYRYHADWIFWHVLEHEIHHRGELSLIVGILGRQGLDV